MTPAEELSCRRQTNSQKKTSKLGASGTAPTGAALTDRAIYGSGPARGPRFSRVDSPERSFILPTLVREDLHIEEGDLLEAVVEGDSVVLTPKAAVDKRLNAYLTERLEELRAETWWVGNTALCAGQNTSICNSYHTLFIRFPPAVSDKFFASEGKQYKL